MTLSSAFRNFYLLSCFFIARDSCFRIDQLNAEAKQLDYQAGREKEVERAFTILSKEVKVDKYMLPKN